MGRRFGNCWKTVDLRPSSNDLNKLTSCRFYIQQYTSCTYSRRISLVRRVNIRNTRIFMVMNGSFSTRWCQTSKSNILRRVHFVIYNENGKLNTYIRPEKLVRSETKYEIMLILLVLKTNNRKWGKQHNSKHTTLWIDISNWILKKYMNSTDSLSRWAYLESELCRLAKEEERKSTLKLP